MTSISENEMNIRISRCNVRHVNGMLNISLEIQSFRGGRIDRKKKNKEIKNTWETIVILEILNVVMQKKKLKRLIYHQ